MAPAACAVLEDSFNGIRAAKAAGMRCVAVAQTFPASRLQEADVVRNSVADVQLDDLLLETG
jgi:beta-phosphoglucomutase-like phosphatase (HAD superfamily)